MTEELIQVGRFVLKKMEGQDFETINRLLKVRLKRKRNGLLPRVCENPNDDWGRCRALKPSGKRCAMGRGIFNFFCGLHDPTKKLGVTVSAAKRVEEVLEKIGFRGGLFKFQYYRFQFFASPPKEFEHLLKYPSFSFGTKIKKLNDLMLCEWVNLAMKAEEFAFKPMKCRSCGAPFKQAWGTGRLCIVCSREYCTNCFEKHLQSDEHNHRVKLDLALNDAIHVMKEADWAK